MSVDSANHGQLPQRIYRSPHGRCTTTRYFVDKFPLFLSGASSAPPPVGGFCNVEGGTGKPSGLDTYLLQYRELFSRLDRFGIIDVAANERMFPKAGRIFRRSCGNGVEAVRLARDPDIERLREHFQARNLFDRRETSSFGKSRLDRLREELNEFAGPPYEALYRRWREQGDCVLGDITRSPGQRAGGFASYRLDHDYELFGGAREEDTGMKEMRNIADRGGKHHDPVHGPPGTRVYGLEGVARTVRRGEEMPEARTPEDFSRAGATPVCAAPEPPQTRFVPIVSSGVAPALEELRLVMGIP